MKFAQNNFNQKGFSMLAAVLAVGAVALAGTVGYVYFTQIIAIPKPAPVPIAPKNPAVQTYRDDEYGFEIKYPGYFQTKESFRKLNNASCDKQLGASFRIISGEVYNPVYYDFVVYQNEKKLTPEDFFNCEMKVKASDFKIDSRSKITISGNDGQKIQWNGLHETFLLAMGNNMLEISGNYSAKKPGEIDKIISSIQLFKPQAVVASFAGCIAEGGKIKKFQLESGLFKCCDKLTPISNKRSRYSYVCAQCGDGQCGKGETQYNCPNDCKCAQEGEYGTCCPGLVLTNVPMGPNLPAFLVYCLRADGKRNCAEEGEQAGGKRLCCDGLVKSNQADLCYNPQHGEPMCKEIGTAYDVGWYYDKTGAFVADDTFCQKPICEKIREGCAKSSISENSYIGGSTCGNKKFILEGCNADCKPISRCE